MTRKGVATLDDRKWLHLLFFCRAQATAWSGVEAGSFNLEKELKPRNTRNDTKECDRSGRAGLTRQVKIFGPEKPGSLFPFRVFCDFRGFSTAVFKLNGYDDVCVLSRKDSLATKGKRMKDRKSGVGLKLELNVSRSPNGVSASDSDPPSKERFIRGSISCFRPNLRSSFSHSAPNHLGACS